MENNNFNPYELLEVFGGKPYLNPRNAITWFYADNPRPRGRIVTILLRDEPVLFRAEVYIDDALIATGHAEPDGKSNTLKRVESASVRRALANAGYGTDQAVWWHTSQRTTVEDARKRLGNGGSRRIEGAGRGEAPRQTSVTTDASDEFKNRDVVNAFQKTWVEHGLGTSELKKALGVTRFEDWTRGRAEADSTVQAWVDAQISAQLREVQS